MGTKARILVVGPDAFGSAVGDALPPGEHAHAATALRGLWTLGHGAFDGVLISLAEGDAVMRAIRGMRRVAPQVRIVVVSPPADEPRARDALRHGADDYVLEPVTAADLGAALCLPVRREQRELEAIVPSMQDIVELSEILRCLSEGPRPTVERLLRLLRRAFRAERAAIVYEDLTATDGSTGTIVLEDRLRRGSEVVGSVGLGPRVGGTYATADAAQLSQYCRLVESVMSQAHEQGHWQELAWRDDLSGLHNRRYFDTMLGRLFDEAAAQRRQLTVIVFDIDDFKSYNDRYGHETGDALIREVAALLTRCSREADIVARYGGDEFAVILWEAEQPRVPGSKHPTDPGALAERFRAVIGEHTFKCLGPDAPGPVRISGGLACFPWDGQTCAALMHAADQALLAAKREGKNRIMLAGGAVGTADADSGSAEADPSECR